MLRIEDLSTRLAEAGITAPINLNRAPAAVHHTLVIEEMTGGRSFFEDGFDTPYFQIRSRSVKDNATQARDLAHQADRILLDANQYPMPLGASGHALKADRLGGPPSYLTTDIEGRTTYVCNYYLEIQR